MEEKKNMEIKEAENKPKDVPYIVFEGEQVRAERKFNKVFWALILTILLLVGTNIGWIVYENQFEDVSVTQDIDTGEGDAVVNGVGDLNYGESKTDGESQAQENRR